MNPEVKMLIERHGLSQNDFFNAKGSPVNHIKAKMKNVDARFAYNSTACNSGGHTTRDRHGHCIVCHPASIGFQKRSSARGSFYIACSISKGYSKVGMTTENLVTRIQKLNSRGVGTTSDWQPILEIKCSEPNKLELMIQSKLDPYRVMGLYDNMATENKEIFSCGILKLLEVLNEAITKVEIELISKRIYATNLEQFNFRNLIQK